ncbi:MAG: hypothetical protein QM516_00095 [Limnohabitans sp.]|nr:hypothetical protein [Limnohabitans sp.]
MNKQTTHMNLQISPNFGRSRAPTAISSRAARSVDARVVWIAAVVITLSGLLMEGCKDGPKTTQSQAVAKSGAPKPASGMELLGDGDEVIGGPQSKRGNVGLKAASASGGSTPSGATTSGGAESNAMASGTKGGRWSVMLATFSTEDHVERANAFRTELVNAYPELATAAVRRLGKGSAIVVGAFDAPQDKAAQLELKRVKEVERRGRRPFATAMLVRTTTDDTSGPPKPFDLRTLRAKFPKVRPLFTLQVAAWSTFGEKGVKYDDMRRAAERYCLDLRAKGNEAWFHHDEDSETSVVTVGNFDRRAYDARTTLFSPEVEDLMRQFPAHLVNGEPLLVPVDPANPKGRSKPQPCRLVEVPET